MKIKHSLWLVTLSFAISMYAISGNATDNKFYVQFNAGAAFAPSFSQISGPFSGCVNSVSGFGCGNSIKVKEKESYSPGIVGSVALGYRIADQFRIEGEALYQNNDMDKFAVSFSGIESGSDPSSSRSLTGERERFGFLLNGYYDFINSTRFTPYITAGLGGYHLRNKYQNSSLENDIDFAWQAGAGVNYRLDDQISFDFKYRYLGGADAELTTQTYFGSFSQMRNVGDHQLLAGIRVGF
jgi:opacity protein-like surface antigen